MMHTNLVTLTNTKIKSRKMRWAGHVERMEGKRNAYRFWWENQKEYDH
jgi:hypothetical protein